MEVSEVRQDQKAALRPLERSGGAKRGDDEARYLIFVKRAHKASCGVLTIAEKNIREV